MRPTQAVISLSAIRHNFQAIKQSLPDGVRLCPAVKANGYGHGATAVARSLQEAGADQLGVSSPAEGAELREAGIKGEINIFSPFFPEECPQIVQHRLSPFVFDTERINLLAEAAASSGERIRVYLKIDTGMGRIGCSPEEALTLCRRIETAEYLHLAGIVSHYAAADAADLAYMHQQDRIFQNTLRKIRDEGIRIDVLSTANSGAVITREIPRDSSSSELLRPGIMIYGYFPSSEIPQQLDLRPAMCLESAVAYIKQVPAGTSISYGMTYTTDKDTRIATIPVGYGDGVPRALSNRGRIWISGRTYPIAGRVCMDQLMVDLGSDSNVQLYDRAVVFGPPEPGNQTEQPWTANDIAGICGTISYEITCAVSARVPRIYRD